jgi:hypothetical protein
MAVACQEARHHRLVEDVEHVGTVERQRRDRAIALQNDRIAHSENQSEMA